MAEYYNCWEILM